MKSKISLDKLALAAQQNIKEGQYWLNLLSGDWSKSTFPYDKKKEKTNLNPDSTKALCESFNFPQQLATNLKNLSKGSEVRLHMILVSGLFILLRKYSGNQDILIGTPILKQNVEADFINTLLVFRNFIEDQCSFKEILLQVRETIIKANENQNYPMQILLEQLHLPVPSNNDEFPLFDIVLIMENLHDKNYLEDINIDMLFSFLQTENGIEGYIEYNSTLYQQSTIKQIIDHYINILSQVMQNVNIQVNQLELMEDSEKHKILTEFNQTDCDYANQLEGKTISQLFEAQVQTTPDQIALIGNDTILKSGTNTIKGNESIKDKIQISYQQLNNKVDQLASMLHQKGVVPEMIVGIISEPAIPMFVSLLGILKTGAAYLPILPSYPIDRIEFMLKDSGAQLLIVDSEKNTDLNEKINKIKTNSKIQIIDFETEIELNNPQTPNLKNSLPKHVDNRNIAYVIYTSGTTGKPKGVLVENRNVIAYLNAFWKEFSFKEGDTLIQLASYTFDVFVEEVYPLLLKGGTILIPNSNEILDMRRLFELLINYRVNIIDCTPVLLNEINRLEPEKLNSLHTFISGGDVLRRDYVGKLIKIGKLYNTYGPTETTVCASYYNCSEEDGSFIKNSTSIPIGKPIANYKIFILDENNQPVPVGVSGELCISGDGMTRGYLNRPELTAEKFFSLPKHSNPENFKNMPNKIYKSGDSARWLWNGFIEFLGRIDQQVKIRGYRIELGEIETQLKAHEDINDAIVIDKVNNEENNSDGNKYLCAFFTSNIEITTTQLREFLIKKLPEYMIPAFFMQIESIPLTPHGKINRNALKAIPILPPKLDTQYEPPTTETEKLVAEVWKELLKIETAGIHDRFFDLGGNSIMVIELTNKLNRILNKDIPVMKMFELATIHKIAQYIDELSPKEIINPTIINDKAEIKNSSSQDDSPNRSSDISKGRDRRIQRIQKRKESTE